MPSSARYLVALKQYVRAGGTGLAGVKRRERLGPQLAALAAVVVADDDINFAATGAQHGGNRDAGTGDRSASPHPDPVTQTC